MAQHFTLPDGRHLDYTISGSLESNAIPLVWIHGTPGAYPPPSTLLSVCDKKNVKIISATRAGYGGSSRLKGRRIVDAVADLQALNEHLGVSQCIVAGWSGGGPHALACAARLKGCMAVLSIAGVAPYDAEGLDWLEGQGEDNIEEHHASLQGEEVLHKFCSAQRVEMLQMDASGLTTLLSSLLPPADKRALENDPELTQHTINSFQEGLKHGVDGWMDDDYAFLAPWGFELSEIKIPVFLYQGSEDLMVPFGHGKWIGANLPEEWKRINLLDEEGHLSIFVGYQEKMIDELLEAAKV